MAGIGDLRTRGATPSWPESPAPGWPRPRACGRPSQRTRGSPPAPRHALVAAFHRQVTARNHHAGRWALPMAASSDLGQMVFEAAAWFRSSAPGPAAARPAAARCLLQAVARSAGRLCERQPHHDPAPLDHRVPSVLQVLVRQRRAGSSRVSGRLMPLSAASDGSPPSRAWVISTSSPRLRAFAQHHAHQCGHRRTRCARRLAHLARRACWQRATECLKTAASSRQRADCTASCVTEADLVTQVQADVTAMQGGNWPATGGKSVSTACARVGSCPGAVAVSGG